MESSRLHLGAAPVEVRQTIRIRMGIKGRGFTGVGRSSLNLADEEPLV
jgi:hypothetical protein